MNLTTATPVEIDYRLADLYGTQNAAEQRIAELTASLHRVAGDHGRPGRSGRIFKLTDTDAIIAATEVAAGDSHQAQDAARLLDRLDALTEFVAECEAAAAPLNAEYKRRPWSRFFLVTSSNGHIHSSMDCSTCRPTTAYGWLPAASGQTEAEAIAERDKLDSAALLCTTCFPNAPVEWTTKPAETGVCPGSGTLNYPRETARLGYVSGNFGICEPCGQPITVTSTGKMRKHKKA